MKKFIQNSLLFFFIVLIINIVLFIMVDKLYMGNYKLIDLSFKTYLLSDSHGLPLENNTEKFGVFNFSTGSDSYLDMHRKTKYLIRNGIVDKIIVTVDDHTLSTYRDKTNNLDRSLYFTTVDDFDNKYTFVKEKFIKHYVPLLNAKSRSIIRTFFVSKIKRGLNLGIEKEWKLLSHIEKKERASSRAKDQFPTDESSKLLKKSLEEIIKTCKENKIELIGIKYPLSTEYKTVIETHTYNADSIFDAHNVKVFDFTNIYENQNNDFFKDQDHLNAEGGKNFALIIRDSILN